MKRFDTSDAHAKGIRGDLANILKNMDAHAVYI